MVLVGYFKIDFNQIDNYQIQNFDTLPGSFNPLPTH